MARPRAWNDQDHMVRWWERGIYFSAAAAGLGILAAFLPALSWIWPITFVLLAGTFLCAAGMLVSLLRWRRSSRTETDELSQMTPDELAAAAQRLRPNTKAIHFSTIAGITMLVLVVVLLALHDRLSAPLTALLALALVGLGVAYVYFRSR